MDPLAHPDPAHPDLTSPDPAYPQHPAVDPHPEPALVVDTPAGAHVLGPATVDSDADERADTAVHTAAGPADPLVLATDVDGDAHVDVVTTIGADGAARTVERGADGTWTGPAPGRWDEGVPPPAPSLDPATGAWIRTP